MDGYSEAGEYGNSKIWETDEIWSEKVRCSSNMKPRFRAEWVVASEELLILASCLLRPISRNSVLEEFSVRRFAVIQDEIWSRALWRWSILESNSNSTPSASRVRRSPYVPPKLFLAPCLLDCGAGAVYISILSWNSDVEIYKFILRIQIYIFYKV